MNIFAAKIFAQSRHFSGTAKWYRHYDALYTEGVKWLAEELECSWLINEILIFSKPFQGKEQFIVADFETPQRGKGVLIFSDGNNHQLGIRKYDFTDLYIDSDSLKAIDEAARIRFFLVYDGGFDCHVLMIPSEY